MIQAYLAPYIELYWPFPTIYMTMGGHMSIMNILTKLLDLVILAFYFVDLLPNIWQWKKPLWWKALNAFLIAMMVIQMPLAVLEVYEKQN